MIKYHYISKYKAMSHETLVYGTFDEELTEGHPFDDAILFATDNLPYYVTYIEESNTVREATRFELISDGIEQLFEGEFLHEGSVKNIHDFEIPEGTVRPVFNYETLEWKESATSEEISEYAFKQSVSFYNSELEFASKATAELACEIISPEMYEDVKSYMKAIDPYAQPSRTRMELKINRPSIFDRYN